MIIFTGSRTGINCKAGGSNDANWGVVPTGVPLEGVEGGAVCPHRAKVDASVHCERLFIDFDFLAFFNAIFRLVLKKAFFTLKDLNLGWFKKVENLLTEYDLPNNFDDIGKLSAGEWKCKVKFSIEKKN